MEAEESKISVWVCRDEKIVSGLSRRTTCADVIRVLLEDPADLSLSGSPKSYCVVEKWRGFERILPNKTKILRLWSAWGEEQENVRFVLLKNEASLPNSGPRSAEARVVLSKERAHKGTSRVTMALSQEKQRRIVRKAFRKLDKINKKKAQSASKDASSLEKMETMVHLVISQDHTIRQQIQRIKELDRDIDRYEAKVHFDRIKMHGINYVQDTYLVETNQEKTLLGEGDKVSSAEALVQFEEYAQRCEEVIQLQEELAEQEALMEGITSEIQEELNQRWMKRRQEELSNKDPDTSSSSETSLRTTAQTPESDAGPAVVDTSSENELVLEEERIRTQLDTSLYIGLRLNTDLEAVKNDLDLTKDIWEAKEKELMDLLQKVNSLDFEEDIEAQLTEGTAAETEEVMSLKEESVWVEQARGLSKTCDINDDDSDTGLSSMHSQDSDSTAIFESLV